MNKKIKTQRNLSAESFSINSDNVIELSFASPAPYLRNDGEYAYNEVLVISEDAVKWDRLVDEKAPLLLDHDTEKQIGVVEKAWIDGEKLKALVRFSENQKAQEILADVKDCIRRNVSFGYIINDVRVEKKLGDVDTVYVTSFEPYEISIVPVPADHTVGYMRSLNSEGNSNMKKNVKEVKQEEEMKEEVLADEEKAEETEKPAEDLQAEETTEVAAAPVAEEPKEEVKAEEPATEEVSAETCEETKECAECEEKEEEKPADETNDILALGELSDEQELAKKAIKEQKSLKEFKSMILDKKNQKNLNVKETKKMEKQFNICNAIRHYWKGDVDASKEIEMSNELTRGMNTDCDFAFRPATRGFGDALVNTNYLPKEYTEMYRPATVLEKAGFTEIPSDGPNISFAVQTSGVVAQMMTLDGDLLSGEPSYALKTLQPHKCGAFVTVPYSLILQARPEIQALVENDIVKGIMECRDAQALIGDGENGEVIGVFNTTGINEVASGAAYTLSGVTSAETMIRASNNYNTNLKFVMNAYNYGIYKTTLKDKSAKGDYLINDEGKMIGYDVLICNQLSNTQVVLGDFSDLIVTPFRGIQVKIDDITLARSSAIKLICHAEFDVLVRKPKSFSVFKF